MFSESGLLLKCFYGYLKRWSLGFGQGYYCNYWHLEFCKPPWMSILWPCYDMRFSSELCPLLVLGFLSSCIIWRWVGIGCFTYIYIAGSDIEVWLWAFCYNVIGPNLHTIHWWMLMNLMWIGCSGADGWIEGGRLFTKSSLFFYPWCPFFLLSFDFAVGRVVCCAKHKLDQNLKYQKSWPKLDQWQLVRDDDPGYAVVWCVRLDHSVYVQISNL